MQIGMQGKNVKEIWKLALLFSIVYREKHLSGGVLLKKENTCARVSFLIKLQV